PEAVSTGTVTNDKPATAPDHTDRTGSTSAATRLVSFVESSGAELWCDLQGSPYMTIVENGHPKHLSLLSASDGARDWLRLSYYALTGNVPGNQAILDACGLLA